MEINFDKVESLIAEGFIKREQHPSVDLHILNYTVKAQFNWHWTPETRACRGLIVDSNNRIVQRPFEKFFSVEQLADTPLPLEPFDVYEKLDGSLGILYWANGEPSIATRGSFVSDQARRGTEFLRARKGLNLDRRFTYLFEIIYPENRIVVDYGDQSDLFLLAIIETETGRELPLQNIGFPVVKKYDGITEFHTLKSLEDFNKEGFVVRFRSGLRVKVKFEEYKRLHKLLTGVSAKVIWQSLREGKSLEPILERTPDEFYSWVRNLEARLRSEYQAIEDEANADYRPFDNRKDAAMYFQTCKHPHVLFAKMDGKDYSDYIWRMIQPKGERAFRCDIDSKKMRRFDF